MTVKEIFDLRRQGRVEEAYEAIRPLYAAHKGRYTTLCMFWTAMDILKKRTDEGRLDEADKIRQALERMLPRVEALEQEDDRQTRLSQPQAVSQAAPNQAAPQQPQLPPRVPLPWELALVQTAGESRSATSAAAAALQSAARRLDRVAQSLQRAKASKCEGDSTDVESRESMYPQEEPAARSSHEEESVSSAESVRQKEDSSVSEEEDSSNSPNSPLKEGQDVSSSNSLNSPLKEENLSKEEFPVLSVRENDEEKSVPSVESVCQDEGIIRPIEGLNAMQRVVLACVVGHPGYSVPRISESTGILQKSIERHIAVLIDRGLIEPRKGELNTAEYYPI